MVETLVVSETRKLKRDSQNQKCERKRQNLNMSVEDHKKLNTVIFCIKALVHIRVLLFNKLPFGGWFY